MMGEEGMVTYRWKLRYEDEDEGSEIDGKEPRIIMRVVRRCKESVMSFTMSCKHTVLQENHSARKEEWSHNVMGTMNSHFLAGVYWAPSSICSHSVRLSYTPP